MKRSHVENVGAERQKEFYPLHPLLAEYLSDLMAEHVAGAKSAAINHHVPTEVPAEGDNILSR